MEATRREQILGFQAVHFTLATYPPKIITRDELPRRPRRPPFPLLLHPPRPRRQRQPCVTSRPAPRRLAAATGASPVTSRSVWPRASDDDNDAARACTRWVYDAAHRLLPLGKGAYGAATTTPAVGVHLVATPELRAARRGVFAAAAADDDDASAAVVSEGGGPPDWQPCLAFDNNSVGGPADAGVAAFARSRILPLLDPYLGRTARHGPGRARLPARGRRVPPRAQHRRAAGRRPAPVHVAAAAAAEPLWAARRAGSPSRPA